VDHDQARQLIDRISVLRQSSDLDLLIFFARHPRTLMASEQLAALTGYRLQQTADSLEVLLKAGLITRSQKAPSASRLYVFVPAAGAEWIHEIFTLATTRPGRVALRCALAARSQAPPGAPAEKVPEVPGPRPVLVRQPAARGASSSVRGEQS
jgi:DNA-binding MarR family transcriptional regulator